MRSSNLLREHKSAGRTRYLSTKARRKRGAPHPRRLMQTREGLARKRKERDHSCVKRSTFQAAGSPHHTSDHRREFVGYPPVMPHGALLPGKELYARTTAKESAKTVRGPAERVDPSAEEKKLFPIAKRAGKRTKNLVF